MSFVTVLLCSLVLVTVPQRTFAQSCSEKIRDCFREQLDVLGQETETNEKLVKFCTSRASEVRLLIGQCVYRSDCEIATEDERVKLTTESQSEQAQIDTACSSVSAAPTTTTPAPTPSVECGSVDGWNTANLHLSSCMDTYRTLKDYEAAKQLNKYGICTSNQRLIDCVFSRKELNNCAAFKKSFLREMVARVKWAYTFDCSGLKLEGKTFKPYNDDNVCNTWEWLACHNTLFESLGLASVNPQEPGVLSIDLNNIIKFPVSAIVRGLAADSSLCSSYRRVDWTGMNRCSENMMTKCGHLAVPRRDSLWRNVFDLMNEVKDNIYAKTQVLTRIQDMCKNGCENIDARVAKIDAVCKENAGANLPKSIFTKFNADQSASSECSKMASFQSCMKTTVIKGCSFIEERAANGLHRDNTWIMAMTLCKIKPGIKTRPGCEAEEFSTGKILDTCSLQANRLNLLDDEFNEDNFCYFLQRSTDCFAQYVAHCPALEARYWSAEIPIMHAANQMLPKCNIAYQTYGNLVIKAVDKAACDVKKWVGCLSDLWAALGVTVNNNNLDLKGFKALLGLVWQHGTTDQQTARCSKVRSLNYDQMERCVRDQSMVCTYPMLTLPDGKQYEQQLRNPFNITVIKNFVRKSCTAGCTKDISARVTTCLNIVKDTSVVTTYPKDIIINANMGIPLPVECRRIREINGCVRKYLNPTRCALFDSGIVQTPAYLDALEICKKPPKPTIDDKNKVDGASQVTLSVMALLIALLVCIM